MSIHVQTSSAEENVLVISCDQLFLKIFFLICCYAALSLSDMLLCYTLKLEVQFSDSFLAALQSLSTWFICDLMLPTALMVVIFSSLLCC